MPCFYLTPKHDDFDQIPELQVCIAEALYDVEAVLSNPGAFKAEEIRTRQDQIVSNLERAWEITGRSEDELTGVRFMAPNDPVVKRSFFAALREVEHLRPLIRENAPPEIDFCLFQRTDGTLLAFLYIVRSLS